jgi:hypothetical protein
VLSILTIAVLLPAAVAAQTVTAPSGVVTVPTAGDFFSSAFQDAADMNDATDVGWFAYGIDQPRANLSGVSTSAGIFRATSSSNDPNIYLLETGNPVSVRRGRRGDVQSIDGGRYRTLALRMRLSGAQGARASDGQLLWSARTIYDSAMSTAGSFAVYGGWQVYLIDIPTLGVAAGPAWTGSIGSLRLDPVTVAGQSIEIDWARLVGNDAATFRTITWSGGGAVDIYLDTDASEGNGTLGLIAKNATTLSRGATGGSFQFQPGALPAGDYYIGIRAAGSSTPLRYSSGHYRVAGTPTLRFTSPSPEGSSDDFATAQLGNAWDMDSVADVDAIANLNGLRVSTRSIGTTAGQALGGQRVLEGTSTAGTMDPILYMLAPWKRGASRTIDTNRYRILTVDLGIDGARSINTGSVARIVWRARGDSENVSEDIIVNHRGDMSVIDTISLDMKTLAIEPGAGSPSHSGWTGAVEEFRVDPHEFTPATDFWVRRVKLAALEQAGTSYRIAWAYDAQGSDATVALFYDTDGAGFNGTRIVNGVNPSDGAYSWNTSGLAAGNAYYIYMQLSDSSGRVVSQAYAPWPIVGGGASPSPSPSPAPPPSASRPIVSIDLPGAGAVTQPFAIAGWAIDAGATANSGIDAVHVWAYPNPGSNAAPVFVGATSYGGHRPDLVPHFGSQFANAGYGLTVRGLNPGVYQFVVFARSRLTGTFNGSRAVTVTVIGNPPRMAIDAPGNNQAVARTFGISGWAFDPNGNGSGVDAVHVWAYPNPGSGTAPRFVGAAAIGYARPDVAAVFGPAGASSGYGLTGTLPPGVYDLVVHARSTATGTFNNVQVIRVTIH